jgi:hypothetical protein
MLKKEDEVGFFEMCIVEPRLFSAWKFTVSGPRIANLKPNFRPALSTIHHHLTEQAFASRKKPFVALLGNCIL